MRDNIFASIELTALLAFLVPLMLRTMKRHRGRVAANLSELLSKLQPLSRVGLEAVAGDMLEPTAAKIDLRSEVRLDRNLTWDLIGGMEGLEIIEKNSEVLIEVAFYLRQWSIEAIEVTEHLRLSAQDIRSEIRKVKRSLRRNGSDMLILPRLQRIAGAYYLMTRRLIALIEVSNAALLPLLRDAL
jgi:hypothetical protein